MSWIRKLLGRERSDLRLRVEGVIAGIIESQPRTHLGATPAPPEACFELRVERAWLPNGRELAPEDIVNPSFVGQIELLDRFEKGDRVRVVCTTISGRQIADIERI